MSVSPLPTANSKLQPPGDSLTSNAAASSSAPVNAPVGVTGAIRKRPAEPGKENVHPKKASVLSFLLGRTKLARSKSYGNLAPSPTAPREASTATSRKQVPAVTHPAANRSNACANITQRFESAANSICGGFKGKQGSLEAQLLQFEKRLEDLEDQNMQKQAKIQVSEAEIVALSEELQAQRRKNKSLEESFAMEKTLFEHKLCEAEFEKLRMATEIAQLKAAQQELKSQIESLQREQLQQETLRRVLHNEVQELKGNIRVFCRIRPILPSDKVSSTAIQHININDQRSLQLLKVPGTDVTMNDTIANGRGPNKYDFAFDRVFGPSATQSEVFHEIAQLVQSAVDGYIVCIFAHGQTGSGKTFTMEGGDSAEMEGMIPRSVRQVFSTCQTLKQKGWSYKIEVSFFEIYNEQIRDLVGDSNAHAPQCKLRVNGSEVFVSNLKIVEVEAERQVQDLLAQAQRNRAVAATKCNEYSSRSHSIFKLSLKGSNEFTSETSKGSLYLVDLAGSARLKESGATGDRLTEMKNINKSLSNLGNVIMALSSEGSHVPYRNSKLTHILQNTLGGSAKTLMFINVSPKESSFNDTLNSLRFAAKVNQCHIGTAAKRTD